MKLGAETFLQKPFDYSLLSLTLEQVHGALAYYLAHQEEIEQYLRQGEAEFEVLRGELSRKLSETKPLLYQKLMAHKLSELVGV